MPLKAFGDVYTQTFESGHESTDDARDHDELNRVLKRFYLSNKASFGENDACFASSLLENINYSAKSRLLLSSKRQTAAAAPTFRDSQSSSMGIK